MEREEIERVEREWTRCCAWYSRKLEERKQDTGGGGFGRSLWGDEGRDNGNTYEKTGQRTGF